MKHSSENSRHHESKLSSQYSTIHETTIAALLHIIRSFRIESIDREPTKGYAAAAAATAAATVDLYSEICTIAIIGSLDDNIYYIHVNVTTK